jgi:hypothetical protein
MLFINYYRALFALILPYFALILPFYFLFSLFLSPFSFFCPLSYIMSSISPFSLPLFIFLPQMTLADTFSLPVGGGGIFKYMRVVPDTLGSLLQYFGEQIWFLSEKKTTILSLG